MTPGIQCSVWIIRSLDDGETFEDADHAMSSRPPDFVTDDPSKLPAGTCRFALRVLRPGDAVPDDPALREEQDTNIAGTIARIAYQAERAAASTRPGNFLAVEPIRNGVLISITADGKTITAPLRKIQLGEFLTVLSEHYANMGG